MLKAWLELMPDGTLPNARIRESVLRLLGQVGRRPAQGRGKRTSRERCAEVGCGAPCLEADSMQLLLACSFATQLTLGVPALPPALLQLPVDTALEDRKEQLKRSGLGRVVMFYFKLPGAPRAALFMAARACRPCVPPRLRCIDAFNVSASLLACI